MAIYREDANRSMFKIEKKRKKSRKDKAKMTKFKRETKLSLYIEEFLALCKAFIFILQFKFKDVP